MDLEKSELQEVVEQKQEDDISGPESDLTSDPVGHKDYSKKVRDRK